eukprot:CAMPEP_0172184846 /NCGR_PEP_ID=MMETSP1050-20130122/19816_1 /TAXON_ID=233186 /ORGANISM="Cryptomonas curvata, Strain CCAP979/52" /LENGTH=169 /DNA_ID=CAMNT_0012858717 /DNA_START=78 /DNA_END=587 /DNA_ORIENTATION=-
MFSTPCFSVTLDELHVVQAPCSFTVTTPESGLKEMKLMSPPSSCTLGRIRESSSSLICATTSSSSSRIRVSWGRSARSLMSGAPELKNCMMDEKMNGFKSPQLMSSSFLVTVMKSGPKKTLVTPSMRNKALASGDTIAARALGKSKVPLSYTTRPGLNLTLCMFGVSCA